MNKARKFYQITKNESIAEINIYGDITAWPYKELGEVSANNIKNDIDALTGIDTINVYINSYGGEVAEALAIYSSLKRHSAKIHTYCDGFACSAATIIFAAGDIRTMSSIALLMIHNCMSFLGYANSEEMRKAAEDNDKINQSSIEAYKKISNLSEDEIKEMMNKETWLTAEECLEYGFATEIAVEDSENEGAKQSAFMSVRNAIIGSKKESIQSESINDKLDEIRDLLEKALEKDPDKEQEDDPKKDQEADPEAEPEENPKEPETDPDEEPEEDPDEPDEETKQKNMKKAIAFFSNLM